MCPSSQLLSWTEEKSKMFLFAWEFNVLSNRMSLHALLPPPINLDWQKLSQSDFPESAAFLLSFDGHLPSETLILQMLNLTSSSHVHYFSLSHFWPWCCTRFPCLLTHHHTKSTLLSTHMFICILVLLPLLGLVSWEGAEDQIKGLVHTRQASTLL